jgi:hypothetical protein
VIAFYCLAIILVIPTLTEVIGIGIVAGIVCALLSHSIFPPANLISEPIGAVACLLTFKALRTKLSLSPAISTLIGTLVSGTTFVIVAMVMVAPAILSKFSTMGAFIAAIIPIVVLTAFANAIIVQILYIPASKVLARGKA